MADEPLSAGGTDLGPSPYQLLSAGLGACTTMTLRMYANLKKIPLTHVTCDVTHNKAHLQSSLQLTDADGKNKGTSKVDVFTRHIRLEGDLSEEQRQALLRIADKCPVHQTLHRQAVVQTQLIAASKPLISAAHNTA